MRTAITSEHRERNAHVSIVGERVYLDATGGVVQGVSMREIFEAFCHSEFLADWEAGVAKYGDQMAPHLMERSDGQRRFDALHAIFGAAAASGKASRWKTVVNMLVGQELLEHHLRRALGDDPPPLDPANPAHRCATADGVGDTLCVSRRAFVRCRRRRLKSTRPNGITTAPTAPKSAGAPCLASPYPCNTPL